MSELNLENLCRLCLKESFLHANIFIDRLPHSNLIYEVLNYVYDLEVTIDDGIPANICRPCFWKLREFEIYKINVHQAKSEIWNLKGTKRDNLIKEEVQQLVISCEPDEIHQELEVNDDYGEEYVPEERVMPAIGEVNAFTTTEIMQKRKGNHFVDSCKPQSSICMRYVECAKDEEELNLESIQDSDECVEQQEKGKRAMISTCEKRETECEHIEMMVPKVVEEDQSNIGENEVASLSENNIKEIKEENEEGLSELRISIVERAKISVISEREDGIRCHHCGDQRETKEEMVAHIQMVHGFGDEEDLNPKKEVVINNCKEIMRKGNLRKRLRARSGRKKHICNICDKIFTYNSNLRRHIRIHSGEKPYKCSTCHFRSSDISSLKRHLRIHSGEKPYKCSICDRKCSQNGHLKRHMRIHPGEKPYKCSICDYRCSSNGNLKSHIIIHSEEKPYKCTICDYKCYRIICLKQHIETHDK